MNYEYIEFFKSKLTDREGGWKIGDTSEKMSFHVVSLNSSIHTLIHNEEHEKIGDKVREDVFSNGFIEFFKSYAD